MILMTDSDQNKNQKDFFKSGGAYLSSFTKWLMPFLINAGRSLDPSLFSAKKSQKKSGKSAKKSAKKEKK